MSTEGFFSDTHLQAFAKSLANRVSAFVETGAEEGKTTRWASENFLHVFTCEIDEQYLSRLHWEMLPANVYLYAMNSPQFIAEVTLLVGNMPLFFLDAHWGNYWPLLDELRQIRAHYNKAIIIVHDCAVPGRPNFWACRGGGADHDGPVCNWEYIRQGIEPDALHVVRLFYPAYTGETPGYCVLFFNCEPCGDLAYLQEGKK